MWALRRQAHMAKRLVGLAAALVMVLLLLQCKAADVPISHLDAFVVNYGQVNRVYLNNGLGAFSGSDATADTRSSRGVALGDLDGDGDLDAFVANYHVNRVYLNDGSGSFSGSDATADAHLSYGVALGDLDGK
jgi:hypothetical protein